MVQDRKGHRLKIAKLLEYPKHQQLYLELEESKFRKRGNYTVHLRFVSKLTSKLEGFYISTYVTADGEKRWKIWHNFNAISCIFRHANKKLIINKETTLCK